jgi:hypothetical protein
MQLDDNFSTEDVKVTKEENVDLEKEFLEEKVKKGIDESYAKGAPGPDGFSFMFYQRLWDIKIDRVNFAMIILIPKEEEVCSS